MSSLWKKDGHIIGKNGSPYFSDHCCCGGCPKSCPQCGQYATVKIAGFTGDCCSQYNATWPMILGPGCQWLLDLSNPDHPLPVTTVPAPAINVFCKGGLWYIAIGAGSYTVGTTWCNGFSYISGGYKPDHGCPPEIEYSGVHCVDPDGCDCAGLPILTFAIN